MHKSRRTRQFLPSAGQRLTLHFLPTYSLWLNRIEATWHVVKAKAGTNAWRDDLSRLTAAYQATLTGINTHILQLPHGFLSD